VPAFTHNSVLVYGICMPSLVHQDVSANFLCWFPLEQSCRTQQKVKFWSTSHPFLEKSSPIGRYEHLASSKTSLTQIRPSPGSQPPWIGIPAAIYVCDHPAHPKSQISKILFCSPQYFYNTQPPPKNKVIWWKSVWEVETTTMGLSNVLIII